MSALTDAATLCDLQLVQVRGGGGGGEGREGGRQAGRGRGGDEVTGFFTCCVDVCRWA
jgi:hypothetical protein